MDNIQISDTSDQRQERLLTTLERLLELPAINVNDTIQQAVQLITEVLNAEKVDAFFHDTLNDTLIARGTSDTPMGRHQKAIGMDRMPLANGGRLVEVFLTGNSLLEGHVDQDLDELAGIRIGLGIVSQIAVVFEAGTQRRGVLMASSSSPEFFSTQDLRFLEAVARWIGIVLDRAETVERLRYQAVEQSRRLVAEELLTVMAHDLRNYLTPLKGRIDLLHRRAFREKRTQDVHDASAAANTLGLLDRLISDLLDVARLNQGLFSLNPQPMDLVEVIQEVVPAFNTAEKPIDTHTPPEVVLSADPDRVRQVLENLLANAVRYAPKNTPVVVKVDIEHRADGPWAILTVSNQGHVISSDLQANLFHPFVAGSLSTGLGLGLYLANNIAIAHSGTLTVDSSHNEVHFTFSIPIERDDMPEDVDPLGSIS
ncbi:MAG: ATP-binding protein [Ktedonobacteraceae bacterium]